MAICNKVAMVSGGFDPLHVGHINLLYAAREYGRVLVALNSDAWLRRKKGFAFMEWQARATILKALAVVDRIVAFNDEDGTVCDALQRYRPDVFCNGGDRNADNSEPTEVRLCASLGIEALYGVDGGKVESSSQLVARECVRRPWGFYRVLLDGARYRIKEAVVDPGARLSLQAHEHRSEHWVVLDGSARVVCDDVVRNIGANDSAYIPPRSRHRLENLGPTPLRIVEVQCGDYIGEDDIVRFDDPYG